MQGDSVDKQNQFVTIVSGQIVMPLGWAKLRHRGADLAPQTRAAFDSDFATDTHALGPLIEVVREKVEHQPVVAAAAREKPPRRPEAGRFAFESDERGETIALQIEFPVEASTRIEPPTGESGRKLIAAAEFRLGSFRFAKCMTDAHAAVRRQTAVVAHRIV